MISFFFRVFCPYRARSYEASRKMKYIHISSIAAGLVIPCVPVAVIMGDSALKGTSAFKPNRFPPIGCIARNPDALFYSLILQLDLVTMLGCTLLVIIIWFILQVSQHVDRARLLNWNDLENHPVISLAMYIPSDFLCNLYVSVIITLGSFIFIFITTNARKLATSF